MIRKTLLLVVSLAGAIGHAQDHVPMTTDGSRWLYRHYSIWDGQLSLVAIDIGNDTVVDGESYRLMTGWTPGALRELDGKVWFRPFVQSGLDTVPLLMYDFTVQIGDTVRSVLDTTAWAIVSDRDSVLIADGSYRDRLHFSMGGAGEWGCPISTWIEGIGDPEFVFAPIGNCFELGMNLECYGIDNVPLLGPCLWLGEGNTEAGTPLQLVPSGSYGRFNLTGAVRMMQTMALHDAIGREVGAIAMSGGSIDLSQHVAGIYFLRIGSSTGMQTIRFCLPQR